MINGQIDAGDIRSYLISKVPAFTGDVAHGTDIVVKWSSTDTTTIQNTVNALIAGSTFIADVTKFATPVRQWTPFQFYSKFTTTEQAAIWGSTDAQVQGFVRQMALFQVVYPDDPSCLAALNYMVSIGLLTSDRPTTILQ